MYGDASVVWTGPVLAGCEVDGGSLVLRFEREHLKEDAIMVLDRAANDLSAVDASGAQAAHTHPGPPPAPPPAPPLTSTHSVCMPAVGSVRKNLRKRVCSTISKIQTTK